MLPFQRDDFTGLFRIMAGLPVTIRLLDPPLHEFLPHRKPSAEVAEGLGTDVDTCAAASRSCARRTPCSATAAAALGISYPGDLRDAGAGDLRGRDRGREETRQAVPEIMIPLVGVRSELEITQAQMVDEVANEVFAEHGREDRVLVGTMIELPRAALMADEIAESAEFFSFGTNDLTQTTFGLSPRRRRRGSCRLHRPGHPADRPLRRRSIARASGG